MPWETSDDTLIWCVDDRRNRRDGHRTERALRSDRRIATAARHHARPAGDIDVRREHVGAGAIPGVELDGIGTLEGERVGGRVRPLDARGGSVDRATDAASIAHDDEARAVGVGYGVPLFRGRREDDWLTRDRRG